MKKKICIKKLIYIICSFVLSLSIFANFCMIPVQAVDISCLPSDVDLSVSYDADNIYMNYNGSSYVVSRDGSTLYTSSSVYPFCTPTKFECDSFGNFCPASYWFSPSTNCVYVLTSSRAAYNDTFNNFYSTEYSYIARTYSDGYFDFRCSSSLIVPKGTPIVCTRIELDSMSSFKQDVPSWSSGLGDSFYFILPSDLLCIFSNYEISGFWEFKSSDTVITPSYYFDYQYIFYVDGVGYTFIDSSRPLKYIDNSGDPTTVTLTFDESCSKYIYTSSDGIDWIKEVNYLTMYGLTFSLNYKWFYDSPGGGSCYTLVYTNDDNFGEEPLVTPEYGELSDVVYSLFDIVFHNNSITDTGINHGVNNSDSAFVLDWLLVSMFTTDYLELEGIHGPDGGWYSYSGQTFLYLVKQIFYQGSNTYSMVRSYLDSINTNIHSDLKSVFDNISLSNTYLSRLDTSINNIPSYTDRFNSVIAGISDIKSINSSIEQLLSNLDLSSGPSSGSPGDVSVSIDTSDLLVELSDINSDLDIIKGFTGSNTLLDVLNTFDNISSGSGLSDVADVFDNLWDDDTYSGIPSYVSGAVAGITSGSIIAGALEFSPEILSGVNFITGTVNVIWQYMGPLQVIILLGASFYVVNMVIRRGE